MKNKEDVIPKVDLKKYCKDFLDYFEGHKDFERYKAEQVHPLRAQALIDCMYIGWIHGQIHCDNTNYNEDGN